MGTKLWDVLVLVFSLGQLEQNQKTNIINLPESIAFKISKAGYGVITGGGPGIWKQVTGAHGWRNLG
jgi:predicted Rossmann-fold nucleotide-binding protein